MYNANSIESFINEVNKEAEEAAQAIYDKHQSELNRRLLAQIKPGDTIYCGMGTAVIESKKGNEVGEKLSIVLSRHQYHSIAVGFCLPDYKK